MADGTAIERFDFIVVGAGTAGCCVAGRLSEAGRSVLLIEAGRDTPPDHEPASIRDVYPRSYGDPSFFWPDLIAETGPTRPEIATPQSRHFDQARVFGGGGNIMGMVALRGLPSDYDEWQQQGAIGWGWDDVLPFFRRLENDVDFDGPRHGQSGPIPIRRSPIHAWPPFAKAIADTLGADGFPIVADMNGDDRDGIGSIPMTSTKSQRVSTAMAYVGAKARQRPNLKIATGQTVDYLRWRDGAICGVTTRRQDGSTVHYEAGETIVSAGALHSPTLLMRSGIGPGDVLTSAGVTVRQDLPGVGANLMNHPMVTLAVHLPRSAAQPTRIPEWGQNSLRYSSGFDACPVGDMQMFVVNKTSWHPLGYRVGALNVCVYKSFSRGSVTLRVGDAAASPEIRFKLLSDDRDFGRIVDGLRRACAIMSSPRLRPVRNEAFIPDGRLVRKLNRPGLPSWLSAAFISGLLDIGPLRRVLLGKAIVDLAALGADEEALRRYVSSYTGPMGHVAGTCRIGAADDPGAVLDPQCRVRGVAGLRVVDGSIMPTMVSANTNVPIIMIAERAASLILADAKS